MLACKCDICGKLFELPSDGKVNRVVIKNRNLLYSNAPDEIIKVMDVCNECLESFNNWEYRKENEKFISPSEETKNEREVCKSSGIRYVKEDEDDRFAD